MRSRAPAPSRTNGSRLSDGRYGTGSSTPLQQAQDAAARKRESTSDDTAPETQAALGLDKWTVSTGNIAHCYSGPMGTNIVAPAKRRRPAIHLHPHVGCHHP